MASLLGESCSAGQGGRKKDGTMQYLVTMDFVDPGPLLPIQQCSQEEELCNFHRRAESSNRRAERLGVTR